ncbi:MAG: arginine--tRNA ligase [Acidobacteriota bacterium]|nr:arginine--tRNA ligase [Acidobacteriota bacterium]
MYLYLQNRLAAHVRQFLTQKYPDIELPEIVVEQPPKIELGEFALPVALKLARPLRKAPLKIAQEIVAEMSVPEGFAEFTVAGAGYINARLDRTTAARIVAADAAANAAEASAANSRGKVLVEHTSINPNKAAHIGHLRNSILGDTLVRLLRAAGYKVDVQNYIDNTGVQVADVVVGFEQMAKLSASDVEKLIASDPRFDFYCWDLYAKVSQWYEADKAHLDARRNTLHLLETGGNPTAELAQKISMAVLRRHLETMKRLDIEYDFLPQESDILHLHFWAQAFEKLKAAGVLYYEEAGKNKGCWVMTRPGHVRGEGESGPDEDAKVIVRSNGTVGYVGKDIAYHMWKFGLLGLDFGYRKFYQYPEGQSVWISCDPAQSEPGSPHFGGVDAIYNVIDARQSEPQETVKQAITLMGHQESAARYTHFSYEMVALTPRCAMELGYTVSEEDQKKSYIEVSGRKGFGVKADDLLDRLIDAAKGEVDSRHPEVSDQERREVATQIAIGALRYFMLKFTKQSVIAFDFREALSFEGETGPYVQYAVVRASNIFRKAGITPEDALKTPVSEGAFADSEDLWSLWLAAGQTSKIIEGCIASTEPAGLTKHAFQLAQQFNNFYHHHHILTEEDAGRKQLLLATAAVVRRELMAVMAVLGIPAPSVM